MPLPSPEAPVIFLTLFSQALKCTHGRADGRPVSTGRISGGYGYLYPAFLHQPHDEHIATT